MRCDFTYCVYNEKLECALAEIRINTVGGCDECIMVSIPQKELKEYKKNTLTEIERSYR